MAQLPPDGEWLVQSIDTKVVIIHRYTEQILVEVDATNHNAMAMAQQTIHDLDELDDEQKCFAHFWFGYFYGCLN